jgi:hypothetical protein
MYTECPGVVLECGHQRSPTAADVPDRRWQGEHPGEALRYERRGQLSRVVVVGEGTGRATQHSGVRAAPPPGRPGAEDALHRCRAAHATKRPQHRPRRHAPDPSADVEPGAARRWPGHRPPHPAVEQEPPGDAAGVEGVRTIIGDERRRGAAGTAAQLPAGLMQRHRHTPARRSGWRPPVRPTRRRLR